MQQVDQVGVAVSFDGKFGFPVAGWGLTPDDFSNPKMFCAAYMSHQHRKRVGDFCIIRDEWPPVEVTRLYLRDQILDLAVQVIHTLQIVLDFGDQSCLWRGEPAPQIPINGGLGKTSG